MNKGKGKVGIEFKPGTKPGKDSYVVFEQVTPPRKKKEKVHATYVSMSEKIPASKKAIDILKKWSSYLICYCRWIVRSRYLLL